MSKPIASELLTSFPIDGAAEFMSTSRDIVRALVESGELRAYDASAGRGKKRCWRITAAALLEFQRQRSNQIVEPPRPRRRSREEKETTQYV